MNHEGHEGREECHLPVNSYSGLFSLRELRVLRGKNQAFVFLSLL
jgi:hypothetical protein